MRSKLEKLPKSRAKLTVAVTAADMVRHFKRAFDELGASVKIAGFRAGKAPRTMIEASVGKSRLLSLGLDSAIQESYIEAVSAEKLSPLAPPNVVINKYPEYGLLAEEIKSDLEYEATLDIFPEVSLGDIGKIQVEDKGVAEVKSQDVEKILKHLQRQKANFLDIDRPAKKGDLAELDYEGFDKGVRLDRLSSTHHPVVLGEGSLIPGFEDEVVGMKKGEEKEFKIRFPKDYHAKEFAGKEVVFKVKLESLKEVQMPELNDEFAKTFDRKGIDDLKAAVKDSLKHEMEHSYEHELEAKVLDKVLPLLKTEIPDVLIEREQNKIVEDFKENLKRQHLDLDTYLKSVKKTPEEFRKEARPQAEKNIRIGLLLGKVIKDQGFDEHDPDAAKKALDFLVSKITKK